MKVLFVGLGGIGQRHLRNLRTLRGDAVEVLAYRVRGNQVVLTDSLGVESEAGLESKYGVRVFHNLDAALAEHPKIAFICNPSSLHVETALACARARCDLFLEKPLADRLDGLSELLELMCEHRLVGYVGYQLRFHPCFQQLERWLAQGQLGRILAVRAEVGEYLPGWHPYEDYRQMYASRRALGGGVILSQIHELDYLIALFGRPRSVFALGGQLSSLEIDVEDVASILMEGVDSLGHVFPIHLHQDYVQRPPTRTCRVVGDSGRIDIDFRALTATRWDALGAEAEMVRFASLERNELFLDEMRHFLACVERTKTPLVSVADGAESLRVALAAHESLATRSIVRLLPA